MEPEPPETCTTRRCPRATRWSTTDPMPRPSAARTTSRDAARNATPDDDGRQSLTEGGQGVVRRLGSDQNDSLATEVEQRLDNLRLAMGGRDGTEHDLVARPIGGRDDVLDHLGVEAVADIGHDTDQV